MEDIQRKLIAKAKKGDKDAFEKLYNENLKWIVYQVSNQLYDRTMIEDAAQDVAIKMWENLKGLRSNEAFKVWLYRIIQNLCRSENLKYRQVRYDSDIESHENILKEDDAVSIPEDATVAKDDNAMLLACMRKLSELQRQTLLLYYYDGLKYREIAAALGVSTSTVSTNIIAAKSRLKKMFEENGITSIYVDGEPGAADKRKPVSLGAAIAMTSAMEADHVFAGVNVPGIVSGVHTKLATVGTVSKASIAGTSKVAHVATLKIVAIVIGVSIVIAGGVGGYALTHDGFLWGSQPAVSVAADHEFDISITFEQDGNVGSVGVASHVNPVGADIAIGGEGDVAETWQIERLDGSIVSDGSGARVDAAVFAGIPVGKYVLVWRVSGSDGSSAKAEREFEIR